MGTRADFYVGRGEAAEWLGSIAWDGQPATAEYPGVDAFLLGQRTEDGWRRVLGHWLDERDDATKPAQGWPWPWKDSGTTDYAYAFDDGVIWCSRFGSAWFDPSDAPDDFEEDEEGGVKKVAVFPDMTGVQNVTHGRRSGLIVVSGGRVRDPDTMP